MMPHLRRTYWMSRDGREILPARCGDFQGVAFYPLQPVEVRKYLCINKWVSNQRQIAGTAYRVHLR